MFDEKLNNIYENIKKDAKNNLINFEKDVLNTYNNSMIFVRTTITNLEKLVGDKLDFILTQGKTIVSMTIKDVENLDKIISGYNPEYILNIGFILAKKQGKVISSISTLNVGDELDLKFKDGSVTVQIIGDKK